MFNQTSIEDSLIPSFDLRSTMPCSFNRTSVKKTLELQQKVGKSKVETVLNTKIPSEINLNSFFVRVSHNNLEEQRRIYKWRMSCSEEFIGISSIKLQSEGNQYNPNLLFKVDMAVSKSNFVQVKDICLTKCVNLIKSVLQGISTLLEYFQPIIFTDKMIYLTQQGSTKVWMDQRFYINPNNELYSKTNKQAPVEESLKSVIQIFKLKCLKTKLSNQLFSTLSQSKTFKEAIQQIQSFERKQSLFPIQGLKISVSTGYALNTSVSLQFSGSKSSKKKKLIDKEIQKDYRTKNLAASSKFLQAKSMEINPSQLNSNKKIREQKMTYQSQHRIYQNEQPRIRSDGFLLQVNPEKPSNSIVISQMFQSDNQLSTIPKKEIDQQISTRSRNHTEPVLNILDRKIKQKDEDDLEQGKQQNGIDSILSKNGWNTNITSLFDRRNVKQSFAQGKQENAHLRGFQLKKLHTMGKDVRESILPVDEEDQDY